MFSKDWALISSTQKITEIQPIKMVTLEENQKEETEVLSAGFPWQASGQILAGNILLGSKCKFLNSNQVKNISPEARERMLGADISNCYASPGNSGGPLLKKKTSGSKTEFLIVGVLAAIQEESGWLAGTLGYKTNYYLLVLLQR